jgi:hypothetical protein
MHAVANINGRLELFARGVDGALIHIWQTSPSGAPWSDWESLGIPHPKFRSTDGRFVFGGIDSAPIAAINADGRLEVSR